MEAPLTPKRAIKARRSVPSSCSRARVYMAEMAIFEYINYLAAYLIWQPSKRAICAISAISASGGAVNAA
jgi:hypothetical protein